MTDIAQPSSGDSPLPQTANGLLAAARANIDRVSPSGLAGEVARGAIVVDIRCGEDRRRTGVIPGSIHVPRTVLEWRADPTSPDRDDRIADRSARLILVCSDGYSSSLAAANLVLLGFHRPADLDGGMSAWLASGYATTPEPPSD